jgi:hypothetical protein
MPSFGGEVKPSVLCRRYPFKWRGTRYFSAKLPDSSRPQFPLSLLEVSHIIVGVGMPGGGSGNFQSWARTISLHGCSTSGGTSHRGPIEEEEEEPLLWTGPGISFVMYICVWSFMQERLYINKPRSLKECDRHDDATVAPSHTHTQHLIC